MLSYVVILRKKLLFASSHPIILRKKSLPCRHNGSYLVRRHLRNRVIRVLTP